MNAVALVILLLFLIIHPLAKLRSITPVLQTRLGALVNVAGLVLAAAAAGGEQNGA